MTRYDSILFDLDGTLWDATDATATGYNNALSVLQVTGYDITARIIKDICGLPFDECVQRVFSGLETADHGLLEATLDKEEKEAIELLGGEVFPDVLAGLPQLAEKYKLFLISNCQDWYLDLFLDKFAVRQYFHGLDCYGTSGVPKEQMIRNTVVGYSLKNSIYIGDTEGDMVSYRNGGVDFGYASYGFGSVQNAELSFDDFSHLLDCFL